MARDPDLLAEAIKRSCQNKAEVVAADEFEQNDIRALLNLGHTFGHAIETGMGYGEWLHGEAVGAGLLFAADLSCREGWIARSDVARVKALLLRASLPVAAPAGMTPEIFMQHMAVDKKNVDGRLRLVLLKQIGLAVVTDQASPVNLQATLRAACEGVIAK